MRFGICIVCFSCNFLSFLVLEVFGTTATTGEGLYEALDWVVSTLSGKDCKKPEENHKNDLKIPRGLGSVIRWFKHLYS